MKVVFLVHRTNYYRYLTPVIQEALNRGHEVECWHDYSAPRHGLKGYSFPFLEHMPVFSGTRQPTPKAFAGIAELEPLLYSRQIDVVCSIYPLKLSLPHASLDSFSFTWVTLMTGPDSFFQIPKFELLKKRENKELFMAYSDFFVEKGRVFLEKYYPSHKNYLDSDYTKVFVPGNPEFDAFRDIQEEHVRDKYGLPSGKKILLYLPFPYCNRNRHSAWERAFCGRLTDTAVSPGGLLVHDKRRAPLKRFMTDVSHFLRICRDPLSLDYLLRKIDEAGVFKSIRKFCDRNDLYLVVKPRLKFPVAEYVKETADLVVWDNEQEENPPILKELLSVTKICAMYFSFASLASIYHQVFCLNINLPDEFFVNDAQRFWFSNTLGGSFNYPGVIETWEMVDVIQKLPQTPLETFDVDAGQHREFVRKFVTHDDTLSSRRVWNIVESEVSQKKDIVAV